MTHGFCKTIAAIDSDCSGGSGQRKLKIWKGHTILDTMKNLCDSWKGIKRYPALAGSLEEVDFNPLQLLWGFKALVEVTADVGGNCKKT